MKSSPFRPTKWAANRVQRKKYKRKSPNKSPQIKNLASGPDIGHGEHSSGQIGCIWLDYVRIGL